MSERPTAYSICVCTLIALHSDPSSPLREIPGFERIAEDEEEAFKDENEKHQEEEDQKDNLKVKLKLFLEECVLGSLRYPQHNNWSLVHAIPLSTFFQQLQNNVGFDVTSLLLDFMTLAASSIDSLMDLMDSLRLVISDGIVDGNSAHGILLRKIFLGFDQLSFETIAILWKDLQNQMQTIDLLSLQQKKEEQQLTYHQHQQQQELSINGTTWPLSHNQLETALRKECFKLEAHHVEISYEETELQIQRILEHDPELPSAHFLRFLNSVKHGERIAALDALHLYFDYAIIKDRRERASDVANNDESNNNNNNNNNNDSNNDQSGKKPKQDILQYAAVLLASLHHSFGDNALASLATDEAVRVAQQSLDAACVAYALGWIFNSEGTKVNISGAMDPSQLLKRCASRAVQGHLRPLAAGASLSLAKHYLESSNGGFNNYINPETDMEMGNLYHEDNASSNNALSNSHSASNDALGTNHNHLSSSSSSPSAAAAAAWTSLADAISDSTPSDGTLSVDRPTHITNGTSSADVTDLLARQRLVGAGIWDYFGQSSLSGISSFIALYCHADHILSKDVVTAIHNIARLSLYGSSLALFSKEFDGSVLHDHIEKIATASENKLSLENDNTVNDSTDVSCIYAQSLFKLIQLWKGFNLPMHSGVFLLSSCFVLHEWAIRRGELYQAEAFGVVLETYIYPGMHNYAQIMIDVFSQKALLYMYQGKFKKAKELVKGLIQDIAAPDTTNINADNSSSNNTNNNTLRTHHVRLLLQLAIIELESNKHYYTSALSPLLQCLSLSNRYEMDGLHATALSILAQVQFRMRNPKRAISLLQASLPSILQQEHVWYQGEAFLTMAKCYLQLAKTTQIKQKTKHQTSLGTNSNNSNNNNIRRLLFSASKELDESEKLFRKCQDCYRLRETFYLQAKVCNMIMSLYIIRNNANTTTPGQKQQQQQNDYLIKRDRASQQFLNMSNYLATVCEKPNTVDGNPNHNNINNKNSSGNVGYCAGVVDGLGSISELKRLSMRGIPV